MRQCACVPIYIYIVKLDKWCTTIGVLCNDDRINGGQMNQRHYLTLYHHKRVMVKMMSGVSLFDDAEEQQYSCFEGSHISGRAFP